MKKYLILERIWNNPVLGNRNFSRKIEFEFYEYSYEVE